MAAAQFETWSRSISEMLLMHVFGCLPSAMYPFIAADNYKKTFEMHNPENPAKIG